MEVDGVPPSNDQFHDVGDSLVKSLNAILVPVQEYLFEAVKSDRGVPVTFITIVLEVAGEFTTPCRFETSSHFTLSPSKREEELNVVPVAPSIFTSFTYQL